MPSPNGPVILAHAQFAVAYEGSWCFVFFSLTQYSSVYLHERLETYQTVFFFSQNMHAFFFLVAAD